MDSTDLQPVGLFFGSFNPLHNGHLGIARYLLDRGYCREVWFVLSPQNPWKEDTTLLEEQKRLAIVRAALEADGRMKACDVEFDMPRPSYTYRTLRFLRERHPGIPFTLVIGGDNLPNLREWRHAEEILAEHRVLVYPRRSGEEPLLPDFPPDRIRLVDAPLADISSTEIRRRVKAGEDISADVPTETLHLIEIYYKD